MVDNWSADEEWGRAYPEGARAKRLLISPSQYAWDGIRPNWRYLFKRSDRRYPDQFWGEVIAYQVGLMLDIPVPPAHVAYSAETGQCAALIEWFYKEGEELFVPAGAFFQRLIPGFDRDRGGQHNLDDALMMAQALIKSDWVSGMADMVTLDCLIGNTDRHQENWGFLFDSNNADLEQAKYAPWFDNGTSMGCEREPQRVASWSEERLAKYVDKGCLHLRYAKETVDRIPHMKLLSDIVEQNERPLHLVRERFSRFDPVQLDAILSTLERLDLPSRLSPERKAWISRLINYRAGRMREILQ